MVESRDIKGSCLCVRAHSCHIPHLTTLTHTQIHIHTRFALSLLTITTDKHSETKAEVNAEVKAVHLNNSDYARNKRELMGVINQLRATGAAVEVE